jgi:hypothetical protein
MFPSFYLLCRFFCYEGFDVEIEELVNHFDNDISQNALTIIHILRNILDDYIM